MALKGVKVLEFAGLAPGPFCGKILADFGATVTRIDKSAVNYVEVMAHGKRTLAINLKDVRGQHLVQRLAAQSDVLIEPFRPGVMEKLNLGPELLCKQQPRLIYARLTGFGQNGRLAPRAGHDINYAALSGVLSMLGRHGEAPQAPINLLADFAGGGLMCAMGILLALLERHHSGCGQVVDAAMVDGAAYVASWLFMSRSTPIWGQERGRNALDGGAYFYDIYKTSDDKYMSVGALEAEFFNKFKIGLGLPQLSQYAQDESEQQQLRSLVRDAFAQKTQAEWARIFEDIDACVYPIVQWQDVMSHDHNHTRQAFEQRDVLIPKPAPRLSRTPGAVSKEPSMNADETIKFLQQELSLNSIELQELIDAKIVSLPPIDAKL